jgi:hypothetical protein
MSDNSISNASVRGFTPAISMKVDYSVNALIKEAADLSVFAKRYWTSNAERPGLSDAGNRLSRDFIPQFNSLFESLKEVHGNYLAMVAADPIPEPTVKRGRKLLKELTLFVGWYEETEESNLAILDTIARVAAANINDLDSPHALAYALYNYASITRDILDLNGPAGGVDTDTADEAFSVVSQLIDAGRSQTTASEEVLSLAALRRKLSFLLQRRVHLLRSTIRFIFRKHPAIIRESEGFRSSASRVTSFQAYRSNKRFMMRRSRQYLHTQRMRSSDTVY